MAQYDEKGANTITKERLLSRVYSSDDVGVKSDTIMAIKNNALGLGQQHHSRTVDNFGSEDAMLSSRSHSQKERHATILFIAAASALACLLLLFAFTHVVPLPATLSSGGGILSCGNTSTEAFRRGCHFDAMLLAWTPQPCFDGKLLDRYRAKTNWTWVDDPNHQGEVSDALKTPEMAYSRPEGTSSAPRKALHQGQGQEGGWVSRWEFHLVHCAYTWELMERAYHGEDGEEVWVIPELYLEAAEHAEHCGELWSRVALYGIEVEREFVSKGQKAWKGKGVS
ncbi:hypothetical protein Daus18300_013946 [Diaporthe australafricana]|uniref:Uncharacterized protein n=1 Tax=Diaporthe australafricana TaxID=127596 RepID=A0ABR3VX77_9PEZI